jgi:hypothetical protein
MFKKMSASLATVVVFVVFVSACGGDTTTTTTVAEQNAPTTAAPAAATAAPTTTTTVPIEPTETSNVTGNMGAVASIDWNPVFNVGNLVFGSSLCGAFTSETEGYEELNKLWIASGEDRDEFLPLADDWIDSYNYGYWEDVPTAAANRMRGMDGLRGSWFGELWDSATEVPWDTENASLVMQETDRVLTPDFVLQPISAATTTCGNTVSQDHPDFRKVERANNVTVSPDDPDWVPTLVHILKPYAFNAYLVEEGSSKRVRQVELDNGNAAYEVLFLRGSESTEEILTDGRVVKTVEVPKTESVEVVVESDPGDTEPSIVAQAMFSVVCDNLWIPEFNPPEKEERPPVTSTTTTTPPGTSSTTTTRPPVVTTTTTTTRPPVVTTTTTTTRPPVVTTTTTTTTVPPTTTTTTTVPPTTTTTTTVPPTTTTTTTVPPVVYDFHANLILRVDGTMFIDITRDSGTFVSFNPDDGDDVAYADLVCDEFGKCRVWVVGTTDIGTTVGKWSHAIDDPRTGGY